jgi:hypothetical protein
MALREEQGWRLLVWFAAGVLIVCGLLLVGSLIWFYWKFL